MSKFDIHLGMETQNDTHLKYPIGPFEKKDAYTDEDIGLIVSAIEEAPRKFKNLTADLSLKDLKKTYRPGSWTVQQLVHHVADIQLLHFLRMKRALTESDYTEVTLINMDGWAATPDGREAPVEDSLTMLEGITSRYVFLIRSLSVDDLKLTYFHPVRKYHIDQAQAAAMSAWHLNHHLAHIQLALGQP